MQKIPKLSAMQSGSVDFKLTRSPGLQELRKALIQLAKHHYATVDFVALEAQRNSAKPDRGTRNAFLPPDSSIVPFSGLDREFQELQERRSRKLATSSSDHQLPMSNTVQQSDIGLVATGSSSSLPASASIKPPAPSGFLYDHDAIIDIFSQTRDVARMEFEEIEKEDTMPLPATHPPPKERKWSNSKLPDSQIEQLPSIELHYN
ncbi:hypothetical protein ABKN59_011083 [Abortiporus biennis]